MTEIRTDPSLGKPLRLNKGMTDARWPQEEGWQKTLYIRHGTEIHYLRNKTTAEIDDFKFKDQKHHDPDLHE